MRFLIILLSFGFFDASASGTDDIEKLVEQWIQIEQQINHVEQQWRQRKVEIAQQKLLLLKEKEQLTQLLAKDSGSQDQIEQKREGLLQDQERLEQSQAHLSKALIKNQRQLMSLRKQLPPPLQQSWQEGLDKLQSLDSESEKLDQQLKLMTSLRQFEDRIATHKESMIFADGQEREVKQFYVGLAFGYYVSVDGQYWGKGVSKLDGWQWQAQPETVNAHTLLNVLDAMQNMTEAKWVPLPVELQTQTFSLGTATQ